MKPIAPELQQLCDAAIGAAVKAGEFIQSVDRAALHRQFKAGGSSEASQIVTEVDFRSEAIIRDCLQPFSERWGLAFVGEESAQAGSATSSERFAKPYFWCVDPLDGTLPFVQGRPGYAVSIALVDQSGEPLLGVVNDPVNARVVHAIQAQGAYRNSSPLKLSESAATTLTVFADESFKHHDRYQESLGTLNACAKHLGLEGISLVYGYGAVRNACGVLDHAPACYLKLPKKEEGGGSIWDFAATACIAGEAGGWASDSRGEPLALNRSGSTFMNEQGVIYASSAQIASYLIEHC